MLHRLLPRKPRVSGKTWSANRRMVDALVNTSALGDMPKLVFEALDAGGDKAANEVSDLFQQLKSRDPEKSKALGTSVNSLLLQKRAKTKPKAPKNPQVAFAPVIPLLLGGGAAALGAGEFLRQLNERRRENPLPNRPPVAAPPQPPAMQPKPPRGPDPRNRPKQTTTPPQTEPPRILTGVSPTIPEFQKPRIWIAPDLAEKIKETILLERRENDDTKAQIDTIRDTVLDGNSDLEHIGGGRDQKTGEDKEETRVPGPGIAFKHPVTGKPGDSRPGSRYADLTFKNIKTGKIFHIQTVDIDKNGKTIARELEAAESIWRTTKQDVVMIPKKWQVEKLLRRQEKQRKK